MAPPSDAFWDIFFAALVKPLCSFISFVLNIFPPETKIKYVASSFFTKLHALLYSISIVQMYRPPTCTCTSPYWFHNISIKSLNDCLVISFLILTNQFIILQVLYILQHIKRYIPYARYQHRSKSNMLIIARERVGVPNWFQVSTCTSQPVWCGYGNTLHVYSWFHIACTNCKFYYWTLLGTYSIISNIKDVFMIYKPWLNRCNIWFIIKPVFFGKERKLIKRCVTFTIVIYLYNRLLPYIIMLIQMYIY